MTLKDAITDINLTRFRTEADSRHDLCPSFLIKYVFLSPDHLFIAPAIQQGNR